MTEDELLAEVSAAALVVVDVEVDWERFSGKTEGGMKSVMAVSEGRGAVRERMRGALR